MKEEQNKINPMMHHTYFEIRELKKKSLRKGVDRTTLVYQKVCPLKYLFMKWIYECLFELNFSLKQKVLQNIPVKVELHSDHDNLFSVDPTLFNTY